LADSFRKHKDPFERVVGISAPVAVEDGTLVVISQPEAQNLTVVILLLLCYGKQCEIMILIAVLKYLMSMLKIGRAQHASKRRCVLWIDERSRLVERVFAIQRTWNGLASMESVLEDFPTVCTDPPRATRRVKRTLAYNTEYLYQYKGYGCSDH
jgi:hypothetical protein